MSRSLTERGSVPPPFDDFMADPRTINGEVWFPGFSRLYVRKRRFLPGGGEVRTIVLAALYAACPGRGAFTRLLAYLRWRYPEWAIYAENVHNDRFREKLVRMGFVANEEDPISFSYPLDSPGDADELIVADDADGLPIDPALDAFMVDADLEEGYVTFPGFRRLYVRKGPREFPGDGDIPCIDLASLQASEPGCGAFTTLFAHLRAR